MTSVPSTEETVEETTTFTTETLEVVPARSIDKLEDITMETTETTETSEMLSEEPSTEDMAKTEGTATETSEVEYEEPSTKDMAKTEGIATETLEVEHEEPSTQDMAKTEETTTLTIVTEMTSVPFTEEVEETTTFTTETLEVVPARSIDKLEDITMETTETTETSEMLSEEPSTEDMAKTEETTSPYISEMEEVITKAPEETESLEVVSDLPFIQEMEVETEEVTMQTTVTTDVTSVLPIKASEEITTETSEMEGSSPLMTSGIMTSLMESSAELTPDTPLMSRMLFTVDPQASIVSDAPKIDFTKKAMKTVKEILKKEKDVLAVTTHSSHETRSVRAAAAWGEEVGSYNAESAHIRDFNQALLLRREQLLRVAFDNITCADQVSESSKELTNVVKSITGYADSGTLTAVVGAGRAGKSAFLSALAGEKDPTMGSIFYNGNEVSAVVRRRATGFCWFGDEHVVWHGTTTVREALCLSAYLRQGDDVPETRKLETIESCLELLGLTDLAGQYISSCSTVETRLVAIGVELAFAPSILLLDEPTSGLDADSAQRIIRVLEQVARTGRTVVCSIADSSPTTELRAFDRLVLLSRGGETIYHGETRRMVQYLEALPGVKGLSSSKSITAWALESVGVRSTISLAARTNTKKKKHRRAGSMLSTSDIVNCEKETRFVQLFQRSEVKRKLLTQMQRAGYLHPDSKEQHVPALITAYRSGNLRVQASSWHTQMKWLVRRVILSYSRSLSSICSVIMTLATTMQWQLLGVVGVLMATSMWFVWVRIATRSTEYDTFDGVNYGASLIAWSTLVLGASFVLGAIARSGHGNAWRENACWRREQAWQAYPAVAYHFCSSVVELVFVLGITLVAAMLTFTLFGFWSITKSRNFALYWVTLAIFALGQVYLAQWLVRLVPSESIAAVAGTGVNLLPLLSFVWSWRSSAVSRLMSLLVSLTPQHYALQVLQALVFDAAADSCVYDGGGIQAESELPCRDLRLIPSDERYFNKNFSYAEIKYGIERGSVALRLFKLGVFLAMFRFLAIVALKKRQTPS
ncbi:hypothetical protein DD237_004614 [Peronospora effusa]|uniref:ABC transporter domain-containing protein n=1 Tax=Peronospora effusa TaxID=542832 RepID=A0A425CGE0_9STRA|nr:hypothetical protein DD237_004614 [Peronospora effusa]